MPAESRKGFTLVETLIAVTIFAVVTMFSLSAFAEMLGFVNNQDTVTTADLIANRALRDMTDLLRPAILPVYVENENRDNKSHPFYDIDHRTHGFGGSVGKAWLKELKEGMDSIAFVVPIDAQNLGDYLDSVGHLQTGQLRGDVSYLGASPSGTPYTGTDFIMRAGANEPVSMLAVMDAAQFGGDSFESIHTPSASNWTNLCSGVSSLQATSFMAIRFVPVTTGPTGSEVPVVFNEATMIANRGPVDLDGDGQTNGDFHLGKLQLVYSGSYVGQFYRVQGDNILNENVNQIIIPLTPETVLRRVNKNERTPIFRLVDYDNTNMDNSSTSDTAGIIDMSKSSSTAEGLSLSISMLMLEHEGIDANTATVHVSNSLKSVKPRWYETMIPLKNMER